MAIIPAILAAAVAAATIVAHAESVADGQAAFDRGDIGNAQRIWTPLAQSGDAVAAFDLGLLADLGRGQPANAAMALHWYTIAAEAGDGAAALNVAVMLDGGRGGKSDPAGAALWYAIAASRGRARAAFNLGQLYAAGLGVPRNADLAAAWFREAAANGVAAGVRASSATRQDHRLALLAPKPVWPIGTTPARPDRAVEMVWTAAPGPGPAMFFVELVALHDGHTEPVMTGQTSVSVLRATLPADRSQFAWRVVSAVPEVGHYAASPWQLFSRTATTQESQK